MGAYGRPLNVATAPYSGESPHPVESARQQRAEHVKRTLIEISASLFVIGLVVAFVFVFVTHITPHLPSLLQVRMP